MRSQCRSLIYERQTPTRNIYERHIPSCNIHVDHKWATYRIRDIAHVVHEWAVCRVWDGARVAHKWTTYHNGLHRARAVGRSFMDDKHQRVTFMNDTYHRAIFMSSMNGRRAGFVISGVLPMNGRCARAWCGVVAEIPIEAGNACCYIPPAATSSQTGTNAKRI